ncbi:CRISPR-associated endoribonuclease Cas6 [Neolewinella litorea]|uniref:CRISPR-associated endoribonuclease Cas6 n=1 Tax=Neolewinella litorea TaxID=2562452 RepID=A0A4S4NK69_9BACT|nr:CRISPR-associated endoribonuclease Cas6 [Neolewinella litorea]THH40244.1 CRISPR-associated endoribonuclease Cas6 [Neolewinella litorea]
MRLKITCDVLRPGQYISLNHQYELSSYIYHRLADADPEFAQMLHERGFSFDGEPNKVFRFFCFSNLYVPKKWSKFSGHRIQVFARKVSFEVSFLLDRAAQYFIVGAFMNSQFGIGNEDGVLDLKVTGVEVLPEVNFDSPSARFRLITPVYVSKPVEGGDERLSSDHLSPTHEEYTHYFIKNLKRKYRAATEHGLVDDIGDSQIAFRLLTPPSNVRRKPRIIKKGRPGETRIIGYQYDFELTAPPTIQYLGYTVGWGGQNAQGFGLGKKI